MSVSLKAILESIVGDLIEARYAADRAVAELAEHYRTDSNLRILSIPSLNISNVQVDFSFVFDSEAVEPSKGSLDNSQKEKVVKDAAVTLSETLLKMPAINQQFKTSTERKRFTMTLKNALTEHFASTMGKQEESPGSFNHNTIKTIGNVLSNNSIESIPTFEYAGLQSIIENLRVDLNVIPTAPLKFGTRVLVGSDSLSKVDPAVVSRISFSVDLSAKRWTEVYDDNASKKTSYVLTDE